jgi:hypothetical protein
MQRSLIRSTNYSSEQARNLSLSSAPSCYVTLDALQQQQQQIKNLCIFNQVNRFKE